MNKTIMLSCASNLISQWRQRWQHFFEDPWFIASLSPPQSLPIYTVIMASARTAKSSLSSTHSKARHYDRWVLDFIDLEAES